MVAPLYVVRYRTLLCFKDFFAIDYGGYDISLCHLLDVIVQEVAVKDGHISYLAILNRTQTVLLMEESGNVDGHGTQ